MSFNRKKNILLVIGIVLVAGASLGYYYYNKGPVDIKNASAIKANAAALYNAFITDTAAAQKKYSGKILLVNGAVAQISANQQGNSVILLKTNNGAGFINCTLERKTPPDIKEDQSIQVKGICSGIGEADEDLGLQPDLYMERCILQP